MKFCFKCEQEKLESQFYKDRTKKDGLNGKCKVCQMEYFNEYIKKNAEKFKKSKAAWYRKRKHATS